MKNIVFVLSDQQHYRTLQANGCAEADTPTLDRLAQEGVNFHQHHVVNPVCSPSRGAIWTGRFPSENGLYGNGCTLPDTERTLPMVFQEAGFATGHFGKLHLEPTLTHDVNHHSTFGFGHCEIGEGDQFLTHDDYNLWLRRKAPNEAQSFYYQMGEKGHGQAYASNLPEDLTLTHWVTQRGIDWVAEQDQDQPFFLSLGYFDPHHAWNPSEPYASRWAQRACPLPEHDPQDIQLKPDHWGQTGGPAQDPFYLSSIIRSYHAMISHIDANLARLIEALRASGRLEDTVFVFSSDHGEFLGNHGRLFKGPYLCDDLLRVPMIVWDGAGRTRTMGDVDAPTSAMDFFATLPAMAGIHATPPTTSHRFMDADLNACPDGARDHVISEWRMQPFHEGSGGNILSVRTRDERYVRYANTGDEEYYRHADDPGERRNLAGDGSTAARRAELAALLDLQGPGVGDWPVPPARW